MIDSPRDLLTKLFQYIGEQLKDIDPRAFHLSRTKDFLRHPADLAGLPGVEFDIRSEGDHTWLRIPRLEAGQPPVVTAEFRPMISVSQNPNGTAPSLNEAALQQRVMELISHSTSANHAGLEANLRASAASALQEYTGIWKAWAEGEKPRRKTITLYGDLFALKQQMEAEETAKPTELVWGVGIATWQLSYEGRAFAFQYPLLTQASEISLDQRSMALEIRPRATDTRVELDAFVACSVVGVAEVEKTARDYLSQHSERPVTPFDPGSYSAILKMIAANVDGEGSYRELASADVPLPEPGDHLVITDRWVVWSRPKGTNYLIDDLIRLQEKLRQGCDIPPGPLALVSPPSDQPVTYEGVSFRGLSSRGTSGPTTRELYFPLPYNGEQVTIIERLESAAGVTVQGPPGTGKTHTIANIICHYLATGKRVLVTSKGEPALEVLQTKIPEEVRPLTVALLTNDREGIRQFQASIEAIQHRVSQLSPEQTREDIGILSQAIDRAHSELTLIDRRVDEIALAQLSELEVDGIPMNAQKMADLVISGESQFAWFDDTLSLSDRHMPPMSEDEAGYLREARRLLGADLVYALARVPAADQMPSSNDIAELHRILCRMKQLDLAEEEGRLLPLTATTPEVLASARRLLELLNEARVFIADLESFGAEWPMQLREKCRQRTLRSERAAMESLFAEIDQLCAARADFLKRPVEFPEEALRHPKTRTAIDRASETGKPFGSLALGVSEVKQYISSVKIVGVSPAGVDDWAHIKRYLILHERVISFTVRWNQFAQALSVPPLQGGISSLRTIEEVALTAKRAHQLGSELDRELVEQAAVVFATPPLAELLGGAKEIEWVRGQLISHLTRAELAHAAMSLSALREKIAGCTGPVVEALQSFIDEDLGNETLDATKAASKYAELTSELRRIGGLAVELCTVRDFAKRIAESGAPRLAARIRTIPPERSGNDRVLPQNWRKAWNWARLRSHLETIEARHELLTMAARRRDLEIALSRLYKDMVAKAAWLATKTNATPRVLQALAGYATAIRRIGQGTGPNATRYRRDARNSMLDAAGAVPCWIMSHAKISESMPPDIGAFDLVIVDEASQSDLWALPAIVRGKKILVVGDDKQVSPDGGFISSQRIVELKSRFLSEQPYGVEMTPEKSLYDLAARVFAAEQVMLREHFRCVPPIISYSNTVFYKGGIQPLRIPKASERLDPPLIDIYVEQGYRDGRDSNRKEAEAIAEEVEAILADERLAGRTIGVVSLLGMEQAKHIDKVVRERCSASELMNRRFQCGDARTFQGSERDIMFLSMVVDPVSCKAISGNMFEQRFNVAGSRARDRMYLVRSVTAGDLSEKDLRLTLLRHFDKPFVVDEIEPRTLVDLCESGFEKDVYTTLVKRNYRVIPQVKTGAYRIDMVVEGPGDTRLAIECDGDEYHGPGRWQQDMSRQRVLERAGWTFWRCFASTWSLRKDEVLNELLDRLMAMGIEPLGAVDRVANLVEKRTWSQRRSEPDDVDDALNAAISLN